MGTSYGSGSIMDMVRVLCECDFVMHGGGLPLWTFSTITQYTLEWRNKEKIQWWWNRRDLKEHDVANIHALSCPTSSPWNQTFFSRCVYRLSSLTSLAKMANVRTVQSQINFYHEHSPVYYTSWFISFEDCQRRRWSFTSSHTSYITGITVPLSSRQKSVILYQRGKKSLVTTVILKYSNVGVVVFAISRHGG